jgi:hypothetical protein
MDAMQTGSAEMQEALKESSPFCEISDSHGGEHENGCLLD